jgi:hypothetical protein
VLKITEGDRVDVYFLRQDGDDYLLDKLDPTGELHEPYRLSDAGCSCPGFARHKRCKHHDALKALRAAGKL